MTQRRSTRGYDSGRCSAAAYRTEILIGIREAIEAIETIDMIDFDRIRGWLLGSIACAIITLLVGCRTTKYVPVENVRTEYKDRVKTVHDTVKDSVQKHNFTFQKDSMAMSMNGDTVKIEHWHTLKLVYYEKQKSENTTNTSDSASALKTDSVQAPYPVGRHLSRWERVKMDFGTAAIAIAAIAIIAGIGVLVWWLRKKIRRNI